MACGRTPPPGYAVRHEQVEWVHSSGRRSHPWRYIVTCPDGTEEDFARRREADQWITDNLQPGTTANLGRPEYNAISTADGPFYVIVDTTPPRPPYGSPERAVYDKDRGA